MTQKEIKTLIIKFTNKSNSNINLLHKLFAKALIGDADKVIQQMKNYIQTSEISKFDIQTVANDLTIKLTDKQIETILENYDIEITSNPADNWTEVVENMIYNI